MADQYNRPIAKLGELVLIAKESDIPKIGKEDTGLDVIVQQWNLETKVLEGEFELEKLLKFNPWEDVIDPKEIQRIKSVLGLEESQEFKVKMR